ncbi:metallothiol transferase isoform A [Chlorella sorokiniana]|uniref:Metallothiol transferase isoform A n=1 Tax=Chlorella sorokiniana TaxID=3076 RepID=A0A2P6TEX2_CHLSO|nr:metallothiol transferase isoform A [Chlorella sorokiniana]|eukprot:PRW32522.1 metallothiol transferase isoform A [Chlorella sorokiniana]
MPPEAPAGERRHLPLRAVNHISRVCRNVSATAAFYGDLLGFIPVQRPQSLEEKFEGCWLWRYGLGLHLIEGEPVPRSSEIDPKSDHLSFQADSLEEVAAELERRGVPFVRQTVAEGGMLVGQLFFHDPDNSMIEVCDCHQLPLVPKELDLHRCHTCALEAARLHEEAGDASPRAAAAAAAAAAAGAAPGCGASCFQQAAAGSCASIAEEEADVFMKQGAAGEVEAMCVEAHDAHAEHAEAPAGVPCRHSMDSSCSDACAM